MVLTPFPSDATITGISDVNGGIENNIFFKFATKEAEQTAALEIKNSDGDTVYLESAGGSGSSFAKGGHFFYVQVVGEGLANRGDGSMKNTALETGTYSWTVSVDGDVTVSGEFTIASTCLRFSEKPSIAARRLRKKEVPRLFGAEPLLSFPQYLQFRIFQYFITGRTGEIQGREV